MSTKTKAPATLEEALLEIKEWKMKYYLLKQNVDFAEQMQKKAEKSLGYATKKLESDPHYSAAERKMKCTVVFNWYFKVCDAIITLCKSPL